MLGDGAARGATPGPFARRSRKIHQLSPLSSPSCEPSPLRLLPTPSATHAHEALFTVSPRPYYRPTLYLGFILRHPASYASFVPFAVPPDSCPFSIAFFYRILYFPCRPCALRTPRAPSSRIFRLASLTRHNASGDFYARHG